MRTLSLFALALSFAACSTAEQAADTAGEGIEDAAQATERVARGAVDTAGDGAEAVADLAADAYDEARDLLGDSRVADDARVAVAQVSAPMDTSTSVRGTVTFVELNDGVRVRYDLAGLPAGSVHGFHVHANGSCAPADTDGDGVMEAAGAAGAHLNPGNDPHGAPDADMDEKHAGDLGNVTFGRDGAEGALEVESLAFDGPRSVLGRAIIVHADADEFMDAGAMAGGRVGCGVISLADRRM